MSDDVVPYRCRCGKVRAARALVCHSCWIVLPFVVRRDFVKAPLETRRVKAREIFRILDTASAPIAGAAIPPSVH